MAVSSLSRDDFYFFVSHSWRETFKDGLITDEALENLKQLTDLWISIPGQQEFLVMNTNVNCGANPALVQPPIRVTKVRDRYHAFAKFYISNHDLDDSWHSCVRAVINGYDSQKGNDDDWSLDPLDQSCYLDDLISLAWQELARSFYRKMYGHMFDEYDALYLTVWHYDHLDIL